MILGLSIGSVLIIWRAVHTLRQPLPPVAERQPDWQPG
jgi:cytochrome b561